MLALVLSLLVNLVVGKENYQVSYFLGVTESQALYRCFHAGLCTLEGGCCNGHGVCKVNGTANPVCVCGKPQDCRAGITPSPWSDSYYPSYTGATCDTAPIDSGCCKDGSDDYIFAQSGVCNKRDGTDPESGSKGRILKRLGGGWVDDVNMTTSHDSPSSIDSMIANGGAWYRDAIGTKIDSDSNITSMIDLLTSPARGINGTLFNMMALGWLQVALKDIVHFAYNDVSTSNVTFNGTTYPTIKWQHNTGVTATDGNNSKQIPKQFENTATALVDVGPLYDYATRTSVGPYLNVTPAVTYWTDTHHMSHEFVLAVKFYGLYHNYVARNVEEYFCGKSSISGVPHGNTCTVSVNEQYNLARRSTIRFSQGLVEQSVLQFLLESAAEVEGNQVSTFMSEGLRDMNFDMYFRRDVPQPNGYWLEGPYDKVRGHQEFVGGVTMTDLSHNLISGLDFFLSLRNPEINTTAWNIFGSATPCGIIPADIASDVVNHFHTKTRRFGSRIDPKYKGELGAILHRVNELGLASYKVHADALTDISTDYNNDITAHTNVYYSALTETDSDRLFKSTAASVAVAATVAINDAIMVDRTGYFIYDPETLMWSGATFHPNREEIQSPSYGFLNCYKNGTAECTHTARNAAGALTGQVLDDEGELVLQTTQMAWVLRGALFAQPPEDYHPMNGDLGFNAINRLTVINQFIPEIVNPLFYQFDGSHSLAFKLNDLQPNFLINSLTEVIPGEIGWTGSMDSLCNFETLGCDEAANYYGNCRTEPNWTDD